MSETSKADEPTADHVGSAGDKRPVIPEKYRDLIATEIEEYRRIKAAGLSMATGLAQGRVICEGILCGYIAANGREKDLSEWVLEEDGSIKMNADGSGKKNKPLTLGQLKGLATAQRNLGDEVCDLIESIHGLNSAAHFTRRHTSSVTKAGVTNLDALVAWFEATWGVGMPRETLLFEHDRIEVEPIIVGDVDGPWTALVDATGRVLLIRRAGEMITVTAPGAADGQVIDSQSRPGIEVLDIVATAGEHGVVFLGPSLLRFGTVDSSGSLWWGERDFRVDPATAALLGASRSRGVWRVHIGSALEASTIELSAGIQIQRPDRQARNGLNALLLDPAVNGSILLGKLTGRPWRSVDALRAADGVAAAAICDAPEGSDLLLAYETPAMGVDVRTIATGLPLQRVVMARPLLGHMTDMAHIQVLAQAGHTIYSWSWDQLTTAP